MRIGELSERSGVGIETIRFYEKEGLLTPARRTENNYRAYTEAHLRELMFIHHCRTLDMPLSDVRALLACDATDTEQAEHVHELIAHHVRLVDERITKLKSLKEHLKELASRCSGSHEGAPCGILVGLQEDAGDAVTPRTKKES